MSRCSPSQQGRWCLGGFQCHQDAMHDSGVLLEGERAYSMGGGGVQ